ncbi:hypothetical protein vseg_001378 [Gypsophila vaccaria]
MATAQLKATSKDESVNVLQPQNGAQLTVFNQTHSVMTLLRSHNWSGIPASPGFPTNIVPNIPALFTHLANGNFGSKAAVVYGGFNASGLPCAWVFAWEATAESATTPNKVYVICGPKALIDTMSFDQIRMFLDNSTQAANAVDPVSKTTADAFINDLTHGTATVKANFSLLL